MRWYTRHRPFWLWPVAITLLGAWLRWHRLGDTRLLWDDAYPVGQGIRLLQTGVWPTLGQPTSFLISNPPGQAYFSLLPLVLFSNSFWLAFWFSTTLNVLAVPLLYRLTRTCLSERTALLAAFLYAVSPWVIDYSRTSWSSALLPVGDVLVLGLLLWALAPRAKHANATMVAMFVSLALLGQSYFLALILVPVQAAAVTLTRWRRIPWRGLWVGAALFAVGLVTFGVAVAADLPTQILEIKRADRNLATQAVISPQAAWFGLSYVTGQGYFERLPAPWAATSVEWALGMALALGLAVVGVQLIRRGPDAWVGAALLVWWAVPVAMFSYKWWSTLWQWHLRTTLPAGQLLAAIGLAWLVERWPRLRPAGLAAGAALVLASCLVVQIDATGNAARPGPRPGDRLDMITLNASTEMGARLNRVMAAYGVQEIYGDLPDVLLTAWTGHPVASVTWPIEHKLVIVPDNRPAVYVRTSWGAAPEPLPYSQRVEQVTWPGDGFTALDVIAPMDRAAEAQLPQVQVDWPSDTGVSLLGYTLQAPLRAGQTSTVTTYWRIDGLAETRGQYIFGPYLHLVDSNGAMAVNVSAPGLPGYYYRLGDLYIEPVDVRVPDNLSTGTYHLDLGLYDGLHQMGTTFHPANAADQPYYGAEVVVQ